MHMLPLKCTLACIHIHTYLYMHIHTCIHRCTLLYNMHSHKKPCVHSYAHTHKIPLKNQLEVRLAHSGATELPGMASSLDMCILGAMPTTHSSSGHWAQPGMVEGWETLPSTLGWLLMGVWEPQGLYISPFLDLGGGGGWG